MNTNEETVVLTLLRRQAPNHSSGRWPLSGSECLAGLACRGSIESRGRCRVEKIGIGLFRRTWEHDMNKIEAIKAESCDGLAVRDMLEHYRTRVGSPFPKTIFNG